jgi:hypothetical protein
MRVQARLVVGPTIVSSARTQSSGYRLCHPFSLSPHRSESSETSPVLRLRRMTNKSWPGAAGLGQPAVRGQTMGASIGDGTQDYRPMS